MRSVKKYLSEKNIHRAFKVGIILKGVDGILELFGGLSLFFIKPTQIASWMQALTQYELIEDPRDLISNYLMQSSHQLSIGAELFGAAYLISHGIIKIAIVIGLLKNKLWAYPVGIVIFSLFGLYQIYCYAYSHSIGLVFLTVLDVIVILLTYHEYIYIKRQHVAHVKI